MRSRIARIRSSTTIVGGGFEHLILGGVPREATLLQHLRRSFPNVLDVRLTRGGTLPLPSRDQDGQDQ